jgi:hypothetical protein
VRRHRVDGEPAVGDFLAAFLAIAVIARRDPPFGHLDAHQIALAGALAASAIACCCIASMRDSRPTATWSSSTVERASALIAECASISARFSASRRFAFSRSTVIKNATHRRQGGTREMHSMIWLIAGLIVFLGVHSVRIVAPGFRDRMIAARGENAWKGIYSVVSLAGLPADRLGLRPGPPDAPSSTSRRSSCAHRFVLLMWIAMILLVAAYVRPAISRSGQASDADTR